MDQLLSEEEPDPAARINVLLDDDERQRSDAAELEAEFPEWAKLAAHERDGSSRRTGILAETPAELVAEDVGISGDAASADEAAVHIIEKGQ